MIYKRFLFVAALIIAGTTVGAYFYIQNSNRAFVVNKDVNQDVDVTPIASKITGTILLGDQSNYSNLSPEGKEIVENYHKEIENQLKKQGLDPTIYTSDSPVTSCILKYHDSNKSLIGCSTPKPTYPLYLLDRNTWGNIGEREGRLNLFEGYVESNEYVITVHDDSISYYKAGDFKISIIPNSILADGETYVEIGGMINKYAVAFDESMKTLTVSIFEPVFKDGVANPKIRTAKFVLD